jgi:thioredoxin reductase (NADPH)
MSGFEDRLPDSALETSDVEEAFPRLSEAQIALLAGHGTRRPTRRGDVLFQAGDPCLEFFVILKGKAAVLEQDDGELRVIRVHGPGRFLGELGLLTGQASFLTAVAFEPGEVLAVPVNRLRELLSAHPSLGDLILRAYVARRSMLVGQGTGCRIIGSRFSPGFRRLQEFAARNRVPYQAIDLEQDDSAETLLQRLGIEPAQTPVVIWAGRKVLRNPGNGELARVIGLPVPAGTGDVLDLVIVGAGPAGLAASVYGASEGLTTAVLDAVATGGQAGTSPRIENYLGFPSGISGAELVDRAVVQAVRFGARVGVPAEVCGLGEWDGYHRLDVQDGESLLARCVIIATGARYNRLDVPGLERFEGTCVFYAATAAEARVCRNVHVVVVGGGNSAGQAALYLSMAAAKVTLLIRGSDLTKDMSRYLVDRIERCEGVEVRRRTEVRELRGNRDLEIVVVEDTETGQREELEADVMFVFIGATSLTSWLGGSIALDSHGFVRTGEAAGRNHALETSTPGVFAAGDVRSGSVKRVASAVGEGAIAVHLVHRYLAGERTAR